MDAGPRLAEALGRPKKDPHVFCDSEGHLDLKKVTSFLDEVNALLGHPVRPFQPIKGSRFLL